MTGIAINLIVELTYNNEDNEDVVEHANPNDKAQTVVVESVKGVHKKSVPKKPNTGDNNNGMVVLYVLVLLLAAAAAGCTTAIRKRNTHR